MRIFPVLLGLLVLFLADPTGAEAQRIKVEFLQAAPVIDGIPDQGSDALMNPLALIPDGQIKRESLNLLANLRIGYGTSFLYVLIGIGSDTIIYRDRAYQNGDGFHFTLAIPKQDDSPADEFTVIRCSPGDSSRSRPPKISMWYYNVDLAYQPLKGAKMKTAVRDGITWYELLIPWDNVPPFHPFFGEIGFNLCFVKAVGDKEKVNMFLVQDGKMQSEGSLRKYARLEFGKPVLSGPFQFFMEPERKNIVIGNNLNCRLAILSGEEAGKQAEVFTMGNQGDTITISRTFIQPTTGLSFLTLPVSTASLAPGSYAVAVAIGPGKRETLSVCQPFTVLPEFSSARLIQRLAKVKVPPGSASSFRFQVEDISRELIRIKPYDTAGSLAGKIQVTEMIMSGFEGGEDYFAEKRGILRRAYAIPGDTALYPYTVRIPAVYDPRKHYPLLVFLHGSGEDDRGILTYSRLTEGDFIELAPNGRQVSNCFATPEALADIRLAIDDVIRNYSVDTARIVIGGFSMGGYGALRAFYEDPARYKGVAVVSGHPDLASKWLGGEHPGFTDPGYLSCFRDVPVFVYHSETDRNCPWELAQEMVSGLKSAGARLTLVTVPAGGHSLMDEASRPRFYEWLKTLAGN